MLRLIDPGDANCFLLHEALKNGLILYSDERGGDVNEGCMRYDSREELKYTETATRSYATSN